MPKEPGRLSRWSLPLATAGAVAMIGAPLGYRVGVLPLTIAFLVPLIGVLLSLVVLPTAVTRLVRRRAAPETRRSTMLAAAISALTILWPLFIVLSALGLPAIHDITTDLLLGY